MDRLVFATVSIVGEWSELSTFAKSIVARRATSFGVFFVKRRVVRSFTLKEMSLTGCD